MSGSRVGGPGNGGTLAIPANARVVVRELKDMLKLSEEEVYAMLKECNMDPNETVQRLINQDPFHEVKRKRDKKKETMSNKDAREARSSRPSGAGSSVRGGRVPNRGIGRENVITRNNSESSSPRESTFYQATRKPSTSTASSLTAQLQVQPLPVSSRSSTSAALVLPATPDLAHSRAAHGFQGGWSTSPVHATMADIVKSKSVPNPSTTTVSAQQQYIPASADVSVSVCSSSTDPALHSVADAFSASTVCTIKQDVGRVENQRSVGDQDAILSMELSPVPMSSSKSPSSCQTSIGASGNPTSVTDIKALEVDNPSVPASSSLPQEHSASQSLVVDAGGSYEAQARPSSSSGLGNAGSKAILINNQFNTRAVYQPHQQPVGSQKASGLEWKPKLPPQSPVASGTAVETSSIAEDVRSSPLSPLENNVMLSAATSKLEGLSMQDDQVVIIPNHLQVPEADRTRLSFGSFVAGFGSTFSTSFSFDDNFKSSTSVEDPTSPVEAASEQVVARSITSPKLVTAESYTHQSASTAVVTIASSSDIPVSIPVPALSQPAILKPDPVVQPSPSYPYLPAIQNYPGFGVVPQIIGGQYSYEPTESQAQEGSRLPNFAQPYSDPSTNYYSPVFRPGPDGDTRYTQFGSKYTGSVALMPGQTLASSQEGGSSVVLSTAGPTGQASQTVGITQPTLTMPQQPLPIHAYPAQPAGVPRSPFATNIFGYQYVPPSYTYMHAPYPHNYTGNAGYPQPPAGSSYPSVGANVVKYPFPQYKPAAAAGNAPHAAIAAGYGSYTAAPSGFAISPAVTAGNASGFDDVGGPQYKESNLYISNQQAEGSAVWIQAQLSRDVGGMQAGSYYNMPGQGQHTGYAHPQPTHAHPAFASLYHLSQSGPAPSSHQLFQQPQALSAVGAGAAQGGAYQQPQRSQLNWTNTY